MPLDKETKDFIIKTANMFNQNLVGQLDKNFKHISQRFDDMDKRLGSIENRLETIDDRLNSVNKDTQIIPKIILLEEHKIKQNVC